MAERKNVKYVALEDQIDAEMKEYARERRQLTIIRDVLALKWEIFQLQQALNGAFNSEEQDGDQVQHGEAPIAAT